MEDLCEYKNFLRPCRNTKACHASLYPYLFADEQCEYMFTDLKETGDITPKEHKAMEDQLKKYKVNSQSTLNSHPVYPLLLGVTKKTIGLIGYIFACSSITSTRSSQLDYKVMMLKGVG